MWSVCVERVASLKPMSHVGFDSSCVVVWGHGPLIGSCLLLAGALPRQRRAPVCGGLMRLKTDFAAHMILTRQLTFVRPKVFKYVCFHSQLHSRSVSAVFSFFGSVVVLSYFRFAI